MSIKAVNLFLLAKKTERTHARVYNRYIADMLHIIAQRKVAAGKPEHWWSEIENLILGAPKKNEEKLTVDEIVAQVREMHTRA